MDKDAILGSPKTEWVDASDDEPPSVCRRRGSVDQAALAPATVATTANSSSSMGITGGQTACELALSRNGLTALETEIRLLGERIARVTTFHLAVYKDWYSTLLRSD